MATLSHSESRRLYSWLWDSHISPKNSKWLQDNLTDMDAKVKAMIKLIEMDADSFARRAEMYYKKRPELMKLVEEFYRAYRALAERYDHATGDLRQAHRTITEAFPNQVSFTLHDDSSLGSEPHTPVTPHSDRSFDPDDGLQASILHGMKRSGVSSEDSDTLVGRKGLKQLQDMFQASSEDPKFADTKISQTAKAHAEQDGTQNLKAEMELRTMKEVLRKIEAERDTVLLQYKQRMEKIAELEKQLGLAQKEARDLDQQSSRADNDVKELKEALVKLEAERDSILVQYRTSLQKVSTLEAMIAAAQRDARSSDELAVKAQAESESLKQQLSKFKADLEASRHLYEESLAKISALEAKMSFVEGNAKVLSEKSNKAGNEVKTLKEKLSRMNEEKEDAALCCKGCLETISKLEEELKAAREDVKQLNSEILLGATKLKGAEGQCVLLERINQALQSEADKLAQEISVKDQQLSENHTELEKLQVSLQDQRSRFVQVEANLHALQNQHSQSQEEQRNLALELRKGLQMSKDLEVSKHDLERRIHWLKEENCSLGELNLATSSSEKNLQNETSSLRLIKGKLEDEVRRLEDLNVALQRQVVLLNQEIENLRCRYETIIQQVKSTGLEPDSLCSSLRHLQDENKRLKEESNKDKDENQVLMRKLKGVEDLMKRSDVLESCLSDVNADLERKKSKVHMLKESCQHLSDEKSTLVGEKSALFSQLQMMTENMHKLLEKNAMLEGSLSGANAELEGLRKKSEGLEDFRNHLNSEKSILLAERSYLVSRLEKVETKLENLETRFLRLEDKYGALEKEKDCTVNQVEELRISLAVEKQERACHVLTSETRLSGLEDRIHHLQAENSCRKKDFEEQLDKAVNAQVEIIILQKFIQDMEDKNFSLLNECQKHVEATRFSEKLISELESENMMHQFETEFLLDRIEKLRSGIYQVLKALDIVHTSQTEPEQNFLPCILATIRDDRKSLSDSNNENLQLLVENSVLTTLLSQLQLECSDMEAQKVTVGQDFLIVSQKYALLDAENCKIVERCTQLDEEIVRRDEREDMLRSEMGILVAKNGNLQRLYAVLEKEHVNVSQENIVLQKKLYDAQMEKCMLEEENVSLLSKALDVTTQCEVFKSYGMEKAAVLCAVSKEMNHVSEAYGDLEHEAGELTDNVLMKDVESIHLRQCIEMLNKDQSKLKKCNDRLRLNILAEKEMVDQKSMQVSEARQELRLALVKNAELCSTVEALEKKQKELDITRENLENQFMELSRKGESQDKEISQIREENLRLESQVQTLHEELEEFKMKEVILSSELHERNNEFELWEFEAASFYFDLQLSAIHEVLYEDKVHKLSDLCESLEDASGRSSVEIEKTKQRVHSLEVETEGLRAQLVEYVPVISSLKQDVSSLEHKLILQSEHQSQDQQVAASAAYSNSSFRELKGVICTETGLPELLNLQRRIKAIDSVMTQQMENVAVQEVNLKKTDRLRPLIKSQARKLEQPHGSHHECSEQSAETPEVRNVIQMKDIPLDHVSSGSPRSNSRRQNGRPDDPMLELWESAEHRTDHDLILTGLDRQKSLSRRHDQFRNSRRSRTIYFPESEIEKELGVDKLELSINPSETNQGRSYENILGRLTSDSEKLMSLQISVEELRRKMDARKKKSTKNFEYDKLRIQLQDAENTLIQLMDRNTKLMRMLEDETAVNCDTSPNRLAGNRNLQRKPLVEQARRGSEKVEMLQVEMQKIHYLLLKLEDETKSNKGRSKFSASQTGTLIREFVYQRDKESKKKKKQRFCSCLRSSSSTQN